MEAAAERFGHETSLHLVRAPASIKVADVIRTIVEDEPADPGDSQIADVMRNIARAQIEAVGDISLADLIEQKHTDRHRMAEANVN